MSARENILERIRRGLGRGAAGSSAEQEQLTTYLRRHPRGPLRALDGDLVARFRERAGAGSSTIERVAALADAPAAVARSASAIAGMADRLSASMPGKTLPIFVVRWR